MLPLLLSRYFPIISGPEELRLVPELVDRTGSEFCACIRIDAGMVAQTCRAGFLPMSEDFTGHDVLLVKSHEQRCVLESGGLHLSRSTRRRARGLELRIDYDFDRCLDSIVAHHPDRWLTEKLCEALRSLHRSPIDSVRARSVEIYSGGDLVAGEVGYSCGAAYTSMAGFHRVSGTGAVQLASLGVLLERAGFALWDLGMVLEYKLALGATVYDREGFLERYRLAVAQPEPELDGRWECAGLLASR